MLSPFRLMARLTIAFFVITGYLVVGLCESIWYSYHGRRDRIGAAMGATGRGIVDALADIFR